MKIYFKENKSRKNALLKDKYSSLEYETDLLEEINFFLSLKKLTFFSLWRNYLFFFSILNERLFTQAWIND